MIRLSSKFSASDGGGQPIIARLGRKKMAHAGGGNVVVNSARQRADNMAETSEANRFPA